MIDTSPTTDESLNEASAARPPDQVEAPELSQDQDPDEPAVMFRTRDGFNKRVAQEARSLIRDEYGGADELQARLTRLDALEAAQEEQRRAQLDEVERLNEELEEAREEADKAVLDGMGARYESIISAAAAKFGVTNIDYLMFAVERETDRMDDDERLDVPAFLEAQLEDASLHAAYGVRGHQEPGFTTTIEDDGPGAGPAGRQRGAPIDAMKMSKQEFRDHLNRRGL